MVVKDRSKLSQDPKNIRKRLRRGAQVQAEEIKALANSRKPIEEWDVEELARGRPRNADGHFKGPPPKWITPAVTGEAKRRLMQHAMDELNIYVVDAIKVVADLMNNDEIDDTGKPIVDGRTKLQAAQFIVDHVMGKPKTKVEIDTGDTLRGFLAGALVLPDGAPAHPVIDGTVIDEEVDDGV